MSNTSNNNKNLLNQLKYVTNKREQKQRNKQLKEINYSEQLYFGNLYREYEEKNHRNSHCWSVFISNNPTHVIPPTSVDSVTYTLHPTFRPNVITLTEAPFLLSRRGWGYFTVEARIKLKNGKIKHSNLLSKFSKVKTKSNFINSSHSLHFHAPICTTDVTNKLPFIVCNKKLLNNKYIKYLKSENNIFNKIKFDDMIGTVNDMVSILNKNLKLLYPQLLFSNDLLKLISEFSTVSYIHATLQEKDIFDKYTLEFNNCLNCNIIIDNPIINEIILNNCGNVDIMFMSCNRNIRLLNCISCKIFCKGFSNSYRYEKCDNILTEVVDSHIKIVFLSLYSSNITCNIYNSYNQTSKLISQWDINKDCPLYDNTKHEKHLYAIIWRKLRTTARITSNTFEAGDSLISLIE